MISKKLMDFLNFDYIKPGERLIGHSFKRELNRYSQVYYFYLYIVVENELSGIQINRCILLGSSIR